METKNTYLKCKDFNWDTVSKISYKKDFETATFKNVSRQNIIAALDGVDFDVRYFECGQGGYTTLEKHEHIHIVFILRGCGRVVIGDTVFDAKPFDCFIIPSWAPHQLLNGANEPFGFLCSVNSKRDKYRLLTKEEAAHLRENNKINEAVRIPEGYFNKS